MESNRKEKRTGVACEECRKRKKKCDGLRPTCTLCISSGKGCIYSGFVETRKRKEGDTEYISVLEEQVATLRAQVADLQRTLQMSASVAPSARFEQDPRCLSVGESPNSSVTVKSSEGTKASDTEPSASAVHQSLATELSLSSSAIDDLSALVWRMNVSDKGGPTFIGPAGNFCVPSSADGLAARSGARRMPQTELGHPIPDVCYDVEIKTNLARLFFSQLNPIHQFLPPSVTLTPDLYPFDDLSQTILHSAVFAAGALFSTVEAEREAGIEFATCIDISSVQACREQPSLIMVQALSIAAWREVSLEHNSAAAIYLSMAGGLAVDLGLPVIGLDALSESQLSKVLLAEDREKRLRAFWAFFLVDRISATMLGRNCVIPWRRVQVPLLHSVLHITISLDEVAFSHQCRLWQLHDHFMDQIYSFEFKALQFELRNRLLLSARAELLAFKQAMPQSLQVISFTTTTPPPRSILFLQMSYQMSLLLIHRPYLREPPGSSSFTLALASMSSAATRITQYISLFNKHFLPRNSDVKPTLALPFFLHHILTASIMHLLLATARTVPQIALARRKLQICMDVLSALESTWPIASRAIAQIQELAVQWNVVGALPLKWCFTGGEEGTAQGDRKAMIQISDQLPPESLKNDAAQGFGNQHIENITHSPARGEGIAPSFLESEQELVGHPSAFDASMRALYSDFPSEEQEYFDHFDSTTFNDDTPPWFDDQSLPDLSALQGVFDFPEFIARS